MQLAGKYIKPGAVARDATLPPPPVAYPYGKADGTLSADQYTVTKDVIDKYQQGNHLIWGGANLGLFWATDVQAVNRPKPIEHAYLTVAHANQQLAIVKEIEEGIVKR